MDVVLFVFDGVPTTAVFDAVDGIDDDGGTDVADEGWIHLSMTVERR